MSTSSSIQAHPTASTSISPPTPPPPDELSSINNKTDDDDNDDYDDEDQEHFPVTPVAVMEGARDDLDESGQAKETNKTDTSNGGNVIYTPASTVSSSKADSTYEEEDENSAQPAGENSRGVWNEWWKAEELAAQVGSLSKELLELKAMIEKQAFEEEANDLSRLKANHRSSLASLAEFHRSEMAGLNSTHTEIMKKIELQHMEELRDARRNNGHDRDLVQGLHQSYSKQIESLVMDLSEARREVKEMKLKQPPSGSTEMPLPIDPALEEVSGRSLTVKLTFDNLDARLSIAEIAVPHPGRSFDALLRLLSFSVRNHLLALDTIANFFICRPREEHVEAAMKIRHWYNSALEEKVHFSFTTDADAGDASMQDRWEAEQWKSDEFVLEVLCTAEGWESFTLPPYPPLMHDDDTVHESIDSLDLTSSADKLVTLEIPETDSFNPAAELERINRELGNLQLHQQLQEQTDRELQNYDEDKENCEPPPSKSRKATVESVQDEDEPSLTNEILPPTTKAVPIIKPPKPRQRDNTTPSIPLIWEDSQPTSRTIKVSLEDRLKEFLEKDVEKAQIKGGSGDSWLFDDLFSPTVMNQGKDKEEGTDNGSFFTALETYPGTYHCLAPTHPENTQEASGSGSQSFVDPSILKDGEPSNRHPGLGWKWLSDTVVESPSLVSARRDSLAPTKRGVELPAKDTCMKTSPEETDPRTKDDCQSFHGQHVGREYAAEHPLFNFTDSHPPPAPPSAPLGPQASTRDSPTLPSYAQSDVGTSHDRGESAHGNDDEGEPADIQGAYSDLKSAPPCDTPVMDTAQSVVSSTPLLGSDATGHKSVRFRNKRSYTEPVGLGQRMPPAPFPSLPGSAGDHGSPRSSKYSASRYEDAGYFRSEDNGDSSQAQDDRWNGSQSSAASDYESNPPRGEKKCGFGQGPEAYTWRRDAEEDEGEYPAGSVSPPLSRSSTTTTDRRSEFIAPPNIYPPAPSGNMGPFPRYGFGGMRPMAMGPLGPRGGIPAFSSPQHADMFFQHNMRKMEEMFSGAASNFGPPGRSSSTPSFAGGPVFAPNPPHSVAARSGAGGVPVNSPYLSAQGNGSVIGGSVVNGAVMNGLTRYPFDPWPSMAGLPLHMPHHHHHHMFGPNGEQRRSFSSDSISPLLWNTGNPMTGEQMPVQGHSPSNSNHNHNHNHDQSQQNYPGMSMAPWQLGGNIGQLQSSTPVSQVHGHGHGHGHGIPPQAWFQQPNVPPFEVQWDTSPMPMRIQGPWAGGYSA
ncbi:hypothetical protein K440DRAFT_641645 [Wilcoxina mikolae CBS 423.85]|nr:hypothetical protein K440DRAFT_641645 [Wilcoxina mikolae CBS 423.85]